VPWPELLFVGDRRDGRIVVEGFAKERIAAGIGGPAVNAGGGSAEATAAGVTTAASIAGATGRPAEAARST
jgi:hypothetical protein